MKTHPILFSGPMIRALLAGEKTQTRRVLSVQPDPATWDAERGTDGIWRLRNRIDGSAIPAGVKQARGDLLWARETWQAGMGCDGPQLTYRATPDYFDIDAWDGPDEGAGPSFNYDRCPGSDFSEWLGDVMEQDGPWRPSIYMPRWASRLTLRVHQVSVERLQEISEEDAYAEGVARLPAGLFRDYAQGPDIGITCPRASFQSLWDSLNAKRKDKAGRRGVYAWDANPWVVATTFSVIPENIDAVLERWGAS